MGVSILGICLGKIISDYIEKVLNRLIFFGVIFLGLVVIVFMVVESVICVFIFRGLGVIFLLILVGVVIDIVK